VSADFMNVVDFDPEVLRAGVVHGEPSSRSLHVA
jgi:hypothetical protein